MDLFLLWTAIYKSIQRTQRTRLIMFSVSSEIAHGQGVMPIALRNWKCNALTCMTGVLKERGGVNRRVKGDLVVESESGRGDESGQGGRNSLPPIAIHTQ